MDKNVALEKYTSFYDVAYLTQKYNTVKDDVHPYALVHMNIKNFLYFNAKFGAVAGNEILRLIFEEISKWLNEQEYAGHLYADNFGFLVQCEDMDQLVYERLMALIDLIYRIQDDRIYRNLFISMGIYPITEPNLSFHDAQNLANLCRKETDGLSRRCSSIEIYGENFVSRYMGHMELEAKTADAYKNYEFINFLQPKIDLKTGRIAGAEALLRWFDKDGVPIPLSDFLPILEKTVTLPSSIWMSLSKCAAIWKIA